MRDLEEWDATRTVRELHPEPEDAVVVNNVGKKLSAVMPLTAAWGLARLMEQVSGIPAYVRVRGTRQWRVPGPEMQARRLP